MPNFVKKSVKGIYPFGANLPQKLLKHSCQQSIFHLSLLQAPIHIHSTDDTTTLFHNVITRFKVIIYMR